MCFKKFFSNAILGIMTSTLFSTTSFAMESKPNRIVVATNKTSKELAEKYTAEQPLCNNKVCCVFSLVDKDDFVYASAEVHKGKYCNRYDEIKQTCPDEFLKKDGIHEVVEIERIDINECLIGGNGYGKTLLWNILNYYKNSYVFLEDLCNICDHKGNELLGRKPFCFYKDKFRFNDNVLYKRGEKKGNKANQLYRDMVRDSEDVNYNGNCPKKLEIIIM